ncbi:hypothetical protein AVEN_30822-1 [Araneus ventricosus]|uniref:Uncharacterized protein n=1 Tax=Araneus ventricosus TaxID=182803 RepID=A0A4Y2XAP0_ARAVE|nr:hypothetical protein AVEN_30822-1 [Araneus ventricosus]
MVLSFPSLRFAHRQAVYFHQNGESEKIDLFYFDSDNKGTGNAAHLTHGLSPLSGVKSSKSASLGILKRSLPLISLSKSHAHWRVDEKQQCTGQEGTSCPLNHWQR